MSFTQQLFSILNLQAEVFHNGQYCGNWAIDTSGNDFINFHVVTKGECYLIKPNNEEEPEKLFAGDILLLPRDNQHCLSNSKVSSSVINSAPSISFGENVDADSTAIVCGYFTYNNPFIKQVISHLPNFIVIRHTNEKHAVLTNLVQALVAESTDEAKGSTDILAHIAEVILAIVLRDNIDAKEGIVAANLHPKLSKSLLAFHQALDTKWTVESLAESAFMSRAAYSELFKKVSGVTPMEYVSQFRIANGYQMLSRKEGSILEVALACGYDSESSFSKAFKRVLGISPSQIKKQSTKK